MSNVSPNGSDFSFQAPFALLINQKFIWLSWSLERRVSFHFPPPLRIKLLWMKSFRFPFGCVCISSSARVVWSFPRLFYYYWENKISPVSESDLNYSHTIFSSRGSSGDVVTRYLTVSSGQSEIKTLDRSVQLVSTSDWTKLLYNFETK